MLGMAEDTRKSKIVPLLVNLQSNVGGTQGRGGGVGKKYIRAVLLWSVR